MTAAAAHRKTVEMQKNAAPDVDSIDMDSIDWGDTKLTRQQKCFVLWYINPDLRRCATEAARRAGYKNTKHLHTNVGNILKNENVRKAIRMLDEQFIQKTAEEVYMQILRRKKARVGFRGGEFHEIVNGRAKLKDYDLLTDEQKMCIDGISYEGGRGIPNYILPHRKDEEAFFIDLHNRLSQEKGNGDGFDVEATVDVIKGKLEIKAKMISRNAEITAAASDLCDQPSDRAEED